MVPVFISIIGTILYTRSTINRNNSIINTDGSNTNHYC